MVFEELIPRVRQGRVGQFFGPGIEFIRSNPIVSTAALGTGVVAIAAVTRKKRKKARAAPKRKRTTAKRKGKKKTKTEIKAARLRNLAKARRAKRSGKRKIIRGRGLGTREIKHSGRGTKGKFKLVSFRNKKTGKMVRFKVRK